MGNTIGETTGTGSIKVTGGTNTQSVYGIRIANTGVVNCSNNNIGSISALVSSTNSTNLYAIHLSGDFVGEIKNNKIGSETTSLSINALRQTTRVQSVYGISLVTKAQQTYMKIISIIYTIRQQLQILMDRIGNSRSG